MKERTLLRRRHRQQAHEMYSTSLNMRKMQIKATVRYTLTPVRMVRTKKSKTPQILDRLQGKENSHTPMMRIVVCKLV